MYQFKQHIKSMINLEEVKKLIVPVVVGYAICMSILYGAQTFRLHKATELNDSLSIALETLQTARDELLEDNIILSQELNILKNDYETLEKEKSNLQTKFKEISDTVTPLIEAINTLEKQNTKLAKTNDKYYKDLVEFSKRKELFNKYEYAIYSENKTRTDITYDQLKHAESLCKEKGVDIDYVLSTIMVESGGVEKAKNSKSSASGYGQFIRSTGKMVYENLMGKGEGTYDHSYSTNGNTAIEMMVYYIEYLKRDSKNMTNVVYRYRGLKDASYVKKINGYLCAVGKNIYSLR